MDRSLHNGNNIIITTNRSRMSPSLSSMPPRPIPVASYSSCVSILLETASVESAKRKRICHGNVQAGQMHVTPKPLRSLGIRCMAAVLPYATIQD
jgi:hypothetical protein